MTYAAISAFFVAVIGNDDFAKNIKNDNMQKMIWLDNLQKRSMIRNKNCKMQIATPILSLGQYFVLFWVLYNSTRPRCHWYSLAWWDRRTVWWVKQYIGPKVWVHHMCCGSPHPCWLALCQPAVLSCSPRPTHRRIPPNLKKTSLTTFLVNFGKLPLGGKSWIWNWFLTPWRKVFFLHIHQNSQLLCVWCNKNCSPICNLLSTVSCFSS